MKSSPGKSIVITIDGPAGAGKSTSAKGLAKMLNYQYVDTGAIYRCVALAARQRGILPLDFYQGSPADRDLKEGKKDSPLRGLLSELQAPPGISFAWQGNTHQIFMKGQNVTEAIREEANSQAASSISERPVVREALLDFQRQMGREGGVVLEGRDIGTVVFPEAELKIFLFAIPEERARRRFQEQKQKGVPVNLQEVTKAINERDRQDQERALAPLKPATDARLLDSSQLGISEVLAILKQWAEEVVDSFDKLR